MEYCDSNATTCSLSEGEGGHSIEPEVLRERREVREHVSTIETRSNASIVPASYGDLAALAASRDRLRRRLTQSARDLMALGVSREHWEVLLGEVSFLTIPGDPGWGQRDRRVLSGGPVARSARDEGSEIDPLGYTTTADEILSVRGSGEA